MVNLARAKGPADARRSIKMHRPDDEMSNETRWTINGYPASVVLWTAEEWSRLADRPADAQPFPNGSWCALRID